MTNGPAPAQRLSPDAPSTTVNGDHEITHAVIERTDTESVQNEVEHRDSEPNGHSRDGATQEAMDFGEVNTPSTPGKPATNGHTHTEEDKVNGNGNGHLDSNERPAKRRRVREATPTQPNSAQKKAESPPWKRADADGPTSYTEGGRRKSGRINTIPIQFQPPSSKRLTRRSLNGKAQASPPSKEEPTATRQGRSLRAPQKPSAATNGKTAHTKAASVSSPRTTQKRVASVAKISERVPRRRTPPPPPTRQSARSRRSSRFTDGDHAREATTPEQGSKYSSQDNTGRSPRIKLRISRSSFIPLVHPHQVSKRPKLGTSFEDFWTRAGDIPVEDGGLLVSEDGPAYTDEAAIRDAQLITRIEKEAEDGGLLSLSRCSLFVPEPEEEPPRQWARQDHMVKAMTNFRRLLLAEQQRHRSTAKKLAEACRDEWLRRQPKSAEELAAEAREYWMLRYRSVVRAMIGTWENVRVHVNKKRLEEWEAEEQRRVKAALNEAVSLSEQKLQARQGGPDSELRSDDDDISMSSNLSEVTDDEELSDDVTDDMMEDHSDDDRAAEEDSDNMSSSDSDDADDTQDLADAELTQEQLQEKYANILSSSKPETNGDVSPEHFVQGDDHPAVASADTSDESVDMDDDIGSTDMDSDDPDESGEEADESEDDSADDAGGLLGLLFGKSELDKLKKEADMATNGADPDNDSSLPHLSRTEKHDLTNSEAPVAYTIEPKDALSGSGRPENGKSADAELHLSPNKASSAPEQSSRTSDNQTSPVNGEETVCEDDRNTAPSPTVEEGNRTDIAATPDHFNMDTQPTTPHSSTSAHNTSKASPDNDAQPDRTANISSHSEEMEDAKMDSNEPEQALTSANDVLGALTSNSRTTHKTDIPFLLRGTLREYQHHGLDWLAGLYANNTNGILADEMGLGKTIQTIALLAHLACKHEVWGPHLVIVPTSVMLNWEMEFKKWCPGFKILAYYGTQEERKRKRQGWNNDDVWNVCITSYQLVLQDQQVFKRRRWHYMILDEAHNIKNFKSQRWQTLLGFNTHSRLLLTGTPLQNNLTELWSLLFFLMPAENGQGGFADLQEFHDWFHKPESQILESGREQMDDEAKAIISKLHKVLRPYLLRRLKADVEKQMPAKYEHVEFCRLSKRQRELYDGFLSRADTRNTLASGNYMSIINCLMQLRKVCNHPDLFVDRPIMTSFRMQKSVPSTYEPVERAVHRSLLAEASMNKVSLGFLNLLPTMHETISSTAADRILQLSSNRTLLELREAQKARAQSAYTTLDPSTVDSNIVYLESAARWGRFEELQHCFYLNALRRQQKPIYGRNLVELLTIGTPQRPFKPRPKVPRNILTWFEEDSPLIHSMIPSVDQRADSFRTTIEKFSCATPAVVTRDLEPLLLGRKGVEAFTEADLRLSAPIRWTPSMPKTQPLDPWHEARMRLSIQFPDKRLLQYDCGKLQVLDKLLRKLQAGGHRALIFTQMTKVLDILEQFLNIHGHKYLRLDGATKVEQRQILTDRFNNDPRILCFILSTRSGGLGINLTGADTVIFYDQDWNPAMDKQCQDRCHRIGQTRDVHIYRLVSEHTIEANILRKASQKQMLDDVVIQEGEFTTDTFNKVSVRDVLTEKVDLMSEGVAAADAAIDRVLGVPSDGSGQRSVGRALEQAEDREDVTAARAAEKEIQADDADFTEKPSLPASGASTTRQGTPAFKSALDPGALDDQDITELGEPEYNAWGGRICTIDDYMLGFMGEILKGTKLELPKDKKKGKKKGKDTRKR